MVSEVEPCRETGQNVIASAKLVLSFWYGQLLDLHSGVCWRSFLYRLIFRSRPAPGGTSVRCLLRLDRGSTTCNACLRPGTTRRADRSEHRTTDQEMVTRKEAGIGPRGVWYSPSACFLPQRNTLFPIDQHWRL